MLWAKLCNLSTLLYGLPFLTNLLPKIRHVIAISEQKILHKLYMLFITISVLDLMFISCFILLLYFYLKRKWTTKGPGCEFLSNDHDKGNELSSAPLTEAHVPLHNSVTHATQIQESAY